MSRLKFKKGFIFKKLKTKLCKYKTEDKIEVVLKEYTDDGLDYCYCRKIQSDGNYCYQTVKKENIFLSNNSIKKL